MHTLGHCSYLVVVVKLADEKGICQIVDDGDGLADDGGNGQLKNRRGNWRGFKQLGGMGFRHGNPPCRLPHGAIVHEHVMTFNMHHNKTICVDLSSSLPDFYVLHKCERGLLEKINNPKMHSFRGGKSAFLQ